MTDFAGDIVITLYLGNRTGEAEALEIRLHAFLDDRFGERLQFEVVCVAEQPERAASARLLATPALVRELPFPTRRAIGDLSNGPRVLQALGLLERTHDDGA